MLEAPRMPAYSLRQMPVQKPALAGLIAPRFAEDPQPHTLLVFDPVVIARGPTHRRIAPPFHGQPLRPFGAHDPVQFRTHANSRRPFARNNFRDLDRRRRLDKTHRTNTMLRPPGIRR